MTQENNSSNTTGKSALVGYLLWFFLGGFGAHRFYFGKTKSAIGMLCLTLASAALSVILIGFVGFIALFGWWVYDAIQINKWVNGTTAPASGTQPAGNQSFTPGTTSSAANEPGESQAA